VVVPDHVTVRIGRRFGMTVTDHRPPVTLTVLNGALVRTIGLDDFGDARERVLSLGRTLPDAVEHRVVVPRRDDQSGAGLTDPARKRPDRLPHVRGDPVERVEEITCDDDRLGVVAVDQCAQPLQQVVTLAKR
jgi:hypothetical protein